MPDKSPVSNTKPNPNSDPINGSLTQVLTWIQKISSKKKPYGDGSGQKSALINLSRDLIRLYPIPSNILQDFWCVDDSGDGNCGPYAILNYLDFLVLKMECSYDFPDSKSFRGEAARQYMINRDPFVLEYFKRWTMSSFGGSDVGVVSATLNFVDSIGKHRKWVG